MVQNILSHLFSATDETLYILFISAFVCDVWWNNWWKQLSAKDMIEHFQVSKDTIRRDFSILSERRLVQRTHGGIIPLNTSRQIPSFNDRINQLSQEKKAIAQKAHDFLKPGQIAFFEIWWAVCQNRLLTAIRPH